jgi:uncharacterized peroxidase-related enzyme
MKYIKIHTIETSPVASKENLRSVMKNLGFIPNVFAMIAESPEALNAFVTLNCSFGETTLSPEEQQIVMLATSTENGCAYCVAGHTAFAYQINMSETVIEAMRNMQRLDDVRLETLNHLVRTLVKKKGQASEIDVQSFLNAGYTRQQFFEVVLGVSLKTFSNYASISLKLRLDPVFEDYLWEVPTLKDRHAA